MTSPFDHPLLSALLGDEPSSALFTLDAELAAILRFEAALTEAEAEAGLIPADAARAIAEGIASFAPDIASLRAATARDGLAIPDLVRQLRAHVGEPHGAYVHFGSTSQDAIDTGLILRLKDYCDLLDAGLGSLVAAFEPLTSRFGAHPLTGFTRMQAAIPITAADRIGIWSDPVGRHRYRLKEFRPGLLAVQFGGSSAMPHKQNPVTAETLVALARFNAGMVGPMHSALVSENERSGAAWTLEWMTLPQMCVTAAASVRLATKLIGQIERLGVKDRG